MTFDVIILAPHVDDEAIGCWSVLRNAKSEGKKVGVFYFYEYSHARRTESDMAGNYLGFTPQAFPYNVADDYIECLKSPTTEVYVPSRRDWHPHHKDINARFRQYATHFYSVDMGRGVPLSDSQFKLAALNDLYPSQRSLWDNDAKYYLFEDISSTDYDTYITIAWNNNEWAPFSFLPTEERMSIRVLAKYEEQIRNLLETKQSLTDVFNLAASIAVEGSITVSNGITTLEG